MADHEAESKLKLYVHLGSQPARAVALLCRVNNIEAQEITVDIIQKETRTPEFMKINPMGKLPCIVDDGFQLHESHAIMRYLATTRNVADHWFPKDAKKRALVDAALDWHHLNLRRYASQLIVNRTLVKLPQHAGFYPETDYEARVAEAFSTFPRIFDEIESMLQHGKYLQNAKEVSIADLSMVCELMQISALSSAKDQESVLGSRERIRKWMADVAEATQPHFDDVHKQIFAYGKLIDERRANGADL